MKRLIKILKITGIVLGVIVLFFVIINVSPWTFSKVEENNLLKTSRDDKYPFVIPHGGAKELYPENTIYAYENLIEDFKGFDLDYNFLEIDLVLTKDNILITHHDLDFVIGLNPNYDGVTDKNRYEKDLIAKYTYSEIIDIYTTNNFLVARDFIDEEGNQPFEIELDMSIMEKMIPATIDEIFEMTKDDNYYYILEIKDAPNNDEGSLYDKDYHDYKLSTDKLIEAIGTGPISERVIIGSFHDDVIKYAKEKAPHIKVGAAKSEVTNFSIYSALYIDFFWTPHAEVLILPNPAGQDIPESLVGTIKMLPGFIRKNIAKQDENGKWVANLMGKQLIRDAHRKNIAVFYWTVNDEDEMRLLIENGADGIITDRPDLLIAIINEMKGK